jgi:hypothetical protein
MSDTRIDLYYDLYDDLKGTPYTYNTWQKPYSYIKQHGGNCATTIDATLAEVCRREGITQEDVPGTVKMAQALKMKQPYVRGASYFRGTVIINDNAGAGFDLSHVGTIYDYQNRFIHCHHSFNPGGVTIDENPEVSNTKWLKYWPGWKGYETTGYLDRLGVDFSCERIDKYAKENDGLIPKRHAIWWCHPYLLAVYFSHVCRQYGLPERMAVMCSMREIGPSAWKPGPSRWDQVHGWSERVDHKSLGPFQQQSPLMSGSDKWYWGHPEQVKDIHYSVHRFCEEAEKHKRKVSNNDKEGLTDWIADVQNPRKDLRGAYAEFFEPAQAFIDLGYSMIPNEYRPESKRTKEGVHFGQLDVGETHGHHRPASGKSGGAEDKTTKPKAGRIDGKHDGSPSTKHKFSSDLEDVDLEQIGREALELFASIRSYTHGGGPRRKSGGEDGEEED